jgi:hypothetical protein
MRLGHILVLMRLGTLLLLHTPRESSGTVCPAHFFQLIVPHSPMMAETMRVLSLNTHDNLEIFRLVSS